MSYLPKDIIVTICRKLSLRESIKLSECSKHTRGCFLYYIASSEHLYDFAIRLLVRNIDTFRYLVSIAGSQWDPSIYDSHALLWAVHANNYNAVAELLKDKRIATITQQFLLACEYDRVEIVKLLIADARTSVTYNKCIPLRMAVYEGKQWLVELLYTHGESNPYCAICELNSTRTRCKPITDLISRWLVEYAIKNN